MTAEMDIPLHVLEKITKNFSGDLRIGRGGYGDVYKGVLCDQELIAVKLLHDSVERLDDELFKNEVGNLLTVDHPNIVQFLGYCYETRSKYVKYNGQNRFSKHIHRVLCFDYLQGGSLDKRLHEQSLPPTWSTHYNIIKGICEGLNFLHGREPQILHLDLKPANILLDSKMTPKVADFGLSRLFGGSHTHVTRKMIGTEKYMSPDSITECIISPKNDIFSLGVVIIEIMAGPSGYSDFQEDVPKFIHEVLNKWSNIIEPTMQYRTQLLLQVKMCIDTAMRCVDSQRENRPTIASILDILNEIETDIPNTQLAVMPLSRTIDIKNSLAETLKKMTAEETEDREHVPKIREASSNVEEPSIIEETEDRETSSYVEEGLIIGRTEEKNEILSILSESNTKEMVILPIYGIGGIGKTTLAQLVYSDTKFSGYSQVWVYVSEHLDLYKIGNSIISQLSKGDSNIANMQILHNRLGELFADKRILIVLDDLWEDKPRELDKLKAMLSLGKGRKVILVTTRDEAIARKFCSTVKNVPYKLEILTDDICWAIIKQKSEFENQADKNFLEQIGREIAVKCGGVALAAQSLGYMLRCMTSDQWESVRDSDIWNLSTSEDPSLTTHEVLASLRLSYSHMHKFLQICFSYCAVFPKGHIIAKYDLIYQWIALGFPQPSEIFDSMQLCERYVTQLLGMSFLQYSNISPDELPQDNDAKYFTMHDLVHDLARAMLADKVNKSGSIAGISCQYALITDPSKPLQSFLSCPKNIKALHYLDSSAIDLSDGTISAAECLVVLDLKGFFIQNLPDSIGQLKQLRYLRAPWIQVQRIPTFLSELSKLKYLNLSHSSMKALPDSIGDMKDLMYLDLSGCDGLSELPVSFVDLEQLVHLDLSDCPVHISESWGSFTKLQHLNLSFSKRSEMDLLSFSEPKKYQDFKVLEQVIGKLTKLHYLNLSFSIRSDTIKVLTDREVFGKLTKLQYLNLAGCMSMTSEADIYSLLVGISSLYNLEHLNLSCSEKLNCLPKSIGNLTKLHTLDLTGCNIQKLPAWMVKMASLKIINMTTLDLCSSNLILIAATNPLELKISKLEDVKSLEEAQSIKVIEKLRMKDLILEWTVDCDRRDLDDKDVLEKLVPPDTVKTLVIKGYRSLSFPSNWLIGIGLYFPNVWSITLEDLPNFNSLPPLGQLPMLMFLSLYRLDSLEELHTADSCGELMFPELSTLDIRSCPKLRWKPSLPRALEILYIEASDSMLTSWGECVSQTSDSTSSSRLDVLKIEGSKVPLYQWRLLQHVSGLHRLMVTDCSDHPMADYSPSPGAIKCLSLIKSLDLKDDILTELPTWLLELTSLEDLCITLPKLEKLNDSTRQLPIRLLTLVLSGCVSMVSLPQWLGELTSLRELKIIECKGIRSLPGNIRQLTKLETIQIESYVMYYSIIDEMFSSISADTDEVNIWEWRENYEKEIAKGRENRVRHIWTRQPELDAAGRTAYALVEAPGRTKQSPLQLLPADSAATASSLDTSNGSRINSSGTRADAAPVGDANVVALVPCLSALSIESGSARKNLSVPRFDVSSHSTQNVVRKSRAGVRHSQTRQPWQLVPAAPSSGSSRINNGASHSLIQTGEVHGKTFVSSFAGTSVDSATIKLSDPPADAISTWTHDKVAHKPRQPRQLVPAASSATTSIVDTSSGSRINSRAAAFLISVDEVDIGDLVPSLCSCTSELSDQPADAHEGRVGVSHTWTFRSLFVWLVSSVPCLGKLAAPCMGLESR